MRERLLTACRTRHSPARSARLIMLCLWSLSVSLAAAADALAPTTPTSEPWHATALQALRQTAAQRHYAPARMAEADAAYATRLLHALDPDAILLDDTTKAQLRRVLGPQLPADPARWAQRGFAAYTRYQQHALAWLESEQLRQLIAQAAKTVVAAPADAVAPGSATLAELALDQRRLAALQREAQQLLLRGEANDRLSTVLHERYQQLALRQRQTRPSDVLSTLANAWAGALDPHSEYYPPRTRQPRGQTRAPLQGIGVQLTYDGRFVAVRRVFAGSAAERSGALARGDRIVALAEADAPYTDIVGWPLESVVQRIRGTPGTQIRLLLQPAHHDRLSPPRAASITRDKIALERQRLSKRLLVRGKQRIGIVQIPAFYVDYAALGRRDARAMAVSRDANAALRALLDQDMSALLIDLRGNSGGALTEAVALSGLFIDHGPIVRVMHGDGRIEHFDDNTHRTVFDGPLMVLVDCASASAAEIFAGAMQEHGRAVVVGERTYGKGSVQETESLEVAEQRHPDLGRFRHTMAMYFLPSGRSTQADGVVPDLALGTPSARCAQSERQAPHALPLQRIGAVPHTRVEPPAFNAERLGDGLPGVSASPADAFEQAVALLARWAHDIT